MTSIIYCTIPVDTDTTVRKGFGGAIDAQTIERLIERHFKVVINEKGTVNFEDRNGELVHLYIRVRPHQTKQGELLLKEYRAAKRAEEYAKEQELEMLMQSMTTEEILNCLKRNEGEYHQQGNLPY